MSLWNIIKDSFTKYPDKIWIRYSDISNKESDKYLTRQTVFDLSTVVCNQLDKKNRAVIGLLFDETSDQLVGYFVALIALIRSVKLLLTSISFNHVVSLLAVMAIHCGPGLFCDHGYSRWLVLSS